MIVRGKYIADLPFKAGDGVPAPMGPMLRARHALLTALEASQGELQQLAENTHFTPEGRQAQMQAWFRANALTALKEARQSAQGAERQIAELRSQMMRASVDKGDLAAAMVRSEIRTWLRGLEPAKKVAMFAMGDLDPAVAEAILEAPAELSGVTMQQRARLEANLVEARNPAEVTQITQMEDLLAALASADDVAVEMLGKDAGLAKHEVAELLGAPTLAERHAARAAEFEHLHGDGADAEGGEAA
jgi:hypothetical protein